MFLFVEPVSRNIGMYVPAYPLPILELASFVKSRYPRKRIQILSFPMDYGLPLSPAGRDRVYRDFLQDLAELRPRAVGVSCTAIAQAQEALYLCERIKAQDSRIFVFLGGYFPTLYYEEILSRTSAVDGVVVGEGEAACLGIMECLAGGNPPLNDAIPNLAWKKGNRIHQNSAGLRFDLKKKVPLNLELLRYPRDYDILPYAFSRGCPYHCNFCMEEYIRPVRLEVPEETVKEDLTALARNTTSHTLLISDALFKSFHLFPFLRSLGMRINFETRCDVLDPSILGRVADVCGIFALGLESASYSTLKRMNKVRDETHYRHYLKNAKAIFQEAVKNEIPVMIFMIAGYPGDTERDLQESLDFARELAKNSGPGGHIFKIGECHVYPKTKIHELALSLPGVHFDQDGIFGQNIVTRPSQGLDFETVLAYMKEVFGLSSYTPRLQKRMGKIMPFFRLPAQALNDDFIPAHCFRDGDRTVFDVRGQSLEAFRAVVPGLTAKYKAQMSNPRSSRNLPL